LPAVGSFLIKLAQPPWLARSGIKLAVLSKKDLSAQATVGCHFEEHDLSMCRDFVSSKLCLAVSEEAMRFWFAAE
jgi:hypothetical protein